MSVSTRQVKNKRDGNGALTGKAGVVYDVNVKYQQQGKWRTHVKKGFATKKEAVQYEAEMRTKLTSPSYSPKGQADGSGVHGDLGRAARQGQPAPQHL